MHIIPKLAFERRFDERVILYRADRGGVRVLPAGGFGALVGFEDLVEQAAAVETAAGVAVAGGEGGGAGVVAVAGCVAFFAVLEEDGVEVVLVGLAAEHFVFFGKGGVCQWEGVG